MPANKSANPNAFSVWTSTISFIAVLALLLPGCSGGGGDPASPDITGEDTPGIEDSQLTGASEPSEIQGNKAVWGMWDVIITEEAGLEIIPVRGVQYALDVNMFLQPPAGSLDNIGINIVNMEKLWNAGDVIVDVSLSHPFDGLTQFTGFDVLGVFIGTGSLVANSDTGLHYSAPRINPILKNADGYTRWMNPLEFTTPGLLGFTEGALGNKNVFWNSSLNPYKYFANGLGTTESIYNHFQSGVSISNRGSFITGTTNTRRYDLDFPMVGGFPDVRFQYVVVASWAEPTIIPPGSIPGDFPNKANMQEAFHVDVSTVGSTLYWNNMDDNGGNLYLTLEVYDWQGMGNTSGVAGEISQIVVESPNEFINQSNKLVFYPGDWIEQPKAAANSANLFLDLGQVNPQGPCPYDNDILITIVTREQADYNNGLGGAYPTQAVLSGYTRFFYDFGNVCNDPPVVYFDNCPENNLKVANKTFKWIGEDDVTPNEDLDFRYKLDDGPWSAWEVDLTQGYFENIPEGTHTVYVECRDSDGQVGMDYCDFTVQLPPEPQPPTVEFINCVNYVRTAVFTFNLDISDDFTQISFIKVRYSLNGGAWVNMPDGSTSITLNGLTSGGPNQLIVEVEDLDTMVDQAQCDFNVNFKPNVLIDNCPVLDLNVDNYTFSWTGTDPELDPLEYSYKLDTNPWSAWNAANSTNLTGLGSGAHTFYVRVRDITGGTDQTTCVFDVNFAPTISINNPPVQDVNTTSYLFTWTASDDLDSPLTMSYNVELDGVWQGWQNGITQYNWTVLPSGTRSFKVRVRDNGNPQLWAEDSLSFLVNYKPSVSVTNCPGGVWPSSDITMTWLGSDDNTPPAGLSYRWRLDAGAWSSWQLGTMSFPYTGLADGSHTFEVQARDTGNPQLVCSTIPATCGSCTFTIDSSCANPPPDVTGFVATDAGFGLNNREVQLNWDAIPGCVDWFDIEWREFSLTTFTYSWAPVQSVDGLQTGYLHTSARYGGTSNPIEYRIRARNVTGTSPSWTYVTGYPPLRNIYLAQWCWAEDSSGTNAATTWARAAFDFAAANEFWNKYGINFVSKNPGNFFWITDPEYQDLTGGEASTMHQTYGRVQQPDAINMYYVRYANGSLGTGYCVSWCPGFNSTTQNIYIVLAQNSSGSGNPIVSSHELGHGMARQWDIYQLDGNRNLIEDDPQTCLADDTWCTSPPATPWMFCDDLADYPYNPGASGKTPKQLMWYSFSGRPVADYDIIASQWTYHGWWISNYESNYPYP